MPPPSALSIVDINRLLDRWQAMTSVSVTPEQRLLVCARSQQLTGQQGGSIEPDDQIMAAALAPLVAVNASQYEQFKQLYLAEAAALRQRSNAIDKSFIGETDDATSRKRNDPQRRLLWLLPLAAVCCLCLLLLFVGYPWWISNFCNEKNAGEGICPAVELPPVVQDRPNVVQAETRRTNQDGDYRQPLSITVNLSDRQPGYSLSIGPSGELPKVPDTARRNIILVTMLCGLIGAGLPWLYRRLSLKQKQSRWPTSKQTLDSLSLDWLEPLHLSVEHNRLLPPLRYHETGPLRLDVDQSVSASSKRGMPLLKYSARLRRRDLVFAIPSYRVGDWRTEYFFSLASELQQRGVQVECLYYQHSPRYLSPTPYARNSQRLSMLMHIHERSSWIFCINAQAAFHAEFGHRLSWTDHLIDNDNRLLFADVPLSLRQFNTLTDSGIQVLEYSDHVGPGNLLDYLAEPQSTSLTPIYDRTAIELPDTLKQLGNPATAHLPPSDTESRELVRWLRSSLGDQAFRLLCATAVYPDANWQLARLLGWRLSTPVANRSVRKSADPTIKTAELVNGSLRLFRRLAQLPWSQHSRYPLWLREALVDELSAEDEAHVSDLYRQILEKSELGERSTSYSLTVDKPDRSFAALWRYFSQSSPVQDALFLSVVTTGMLDFKLPAVVSRLFNKSALTFRLPPLVSRLFRKSLLKFGRWLPSLVLGGTAALLFGLLSWIVYGQFTDRLQPEYLLKNSLALYRKQNSVVNVAIGYPGSPSGTPESRTECSADTPAHVQSYCRLLRKLGYGVSLHPLENLNSRVNTIIASDVQWPRLERALLFQNYASTVSRLNAENDSSAAYVLLPNPIQSGQVFRDEFVAEQSINVDLPEANETLVIDGGLDEALEEAQDEANEGQEVDSTNVVSNYEQWQKQLEELNREVSSVSADQSFILPDMVAIPAGSFMMGSENGDVDEQPIHRVTVSAFELARNELTWAEWQLCEDDGGCTEIKRPSFFGDIDVAEQANHPVVNVNIASVNEYIDWINDKTGGNYRLPSEAEWEYATRAGSSTEYWWGDNIGNNLANCRGCGGQWDGQSTAPVGSFAANPFGLNDVHGNVWEWVADCWHDNYEGAPGDGSAWVEDCSDNSRSPLRGGSWFDVPEFLRSAIRYRNSTVDAFIVVGFRLARTFP